MRFLLALLLALHAWPALAGGTCGPDDSLQGELSGLLDAAARAESCETSSANFTLQADAFESEGLRAEVLSLALQAFEKAWERGDIDRRVLMVVDFSRPASKKRLWVIDLATDELLYSEWVGHGARSGRGNYARSFSNVEGSKKSSIGVYRTSDYKTTSAGWKGHAGSAPALKVQGLEKGWNDNAEDRHILIHQAWYTYPGHGGHSEGCFTVRSKVREGLLAALYGATYDEARTHPSSTSHDAHHEGEGHHSMIFAYYPDQEWLSSSEYLKD